VSPRDSTVPAGREWVEKALEFDASIYSAVALQKALEAMSNVVSGSVTSSGDSHFRVLLKIPANQTTLCDEFYRQANDYSLREKIASQTETVRNLILSLAFSRTGLSE
jgi:His-Xaa-Ser system protein HxsD